MRCAARVRSVLDQHLANAAWLHANALMEAIFSSSCLLRACCSNGRLRNTALRICADVATCCSPPLLHLSRACTAHPANTCFKGHAAAWPIPAHEVLVICSCLRVLQGSRAGWTRNGWNQDMDMQERRPGLLRFHRLIISSRLVHSRTGLRGCHLSMIPCTPDLPRERPASVRSSKISTFQRRVTE